MEIADDLLHRDTLRSSALPMPWYFTKSIKHLSTDSYSWSEVFSCARDDFPARGYHRSGSRDLSAVRTVLAGEGQMRLFVGTVAEGSILWVPWRCGADRMMRLGYSTAQIPHGVRWGIGSGWESEVEGVAWKRDSLGILVCGGMAYAQVVLEKDGQWLLRATSKHIGFGFFSKSPLIYQNIFTNFPQNTERLKRLLCSDL